MPAGFLAAVRREIRRTAPNIGILYSDIEYVDDQEVRMPVTPTCSAVYVQELPSGVHTIIGVSTAVTAFLDFFAQGLMNTPVQVFSLADLEQNFGRLIANSGAGYAVNQFSAGGGAEAWVVRVAAATPPPGSTVPSGKGPPTAASAPIPANAPGHDGHRSQRGA
jgi:hypothetical protein